MSKGGESHLDHLHVGELVKQNQTFTSQLKLSTLGNWYNLQTTKKSLETF